MSASSGDTPAISVVVSTRDRADQLSVLLDSLARQTLQPDRFEVVVVDNGSIDSTPQLLENSEKSVPYSLRVLRRPRGEGPAPARNEGIGAASAPLIAFTDDDCVATPEWLAAGTAALTDADLVQGSVRPDPGVVAGPFDRSVWVDCESGLYETANLFARRETIELVGGFEPLFPGEVEHVIGEDVWFGWRARRAGAARLSATKHGCTMRSFSARRSRRSPSGGGCATSPRSQSGCPNCAHIRSLPAFFSAGAAPSSIWR